MRVENPFRGISSAPESVGPVPIGRAMAPTRGVKSAPGSSLSPRPSLIDTWLDLCLLPRGAEETRANDACFWRALGCDPATRRRCGRSRAPPRKSGGPSHRHVTEGLQNRMSYKRRPGRPAVAPSAGQETRADREAREGDAPAEPPVWIQNPKNRCVGKLLADVQLRPSGAPGLWRKRIGGSAGASPWGDENLALRPVCVYLIFVARCRRRRQLASVIGSRFPVSRGTN